MKLKHDKLLSKFAFNVNLRHYMLEATEEKRRKQTCVEAEAAAQLMEATESKLRKLKQAHDADIMGADELAARVNALVAEVGDIMVARLPQDLVQCGSPAMQKSVAQAQARSSSSPRSPQQPPDAHTHQ